VTTDDGSTSLDLPESLSAPEHDTGPWDGFDDPRWPSWAVHGHVVRTIEDADTRGLL
jgi:hypothetical protein